LFLHWSGSKFYVAMAACTPSVHVFLGRPSGKILSHIKCSTHTIKNVYSKGHADKNNWRSR
jgi:hypothetical protein